MGRSKSSKVKKKPSDYPTMSFRPTADKLRALEDDIKAIQIAHNKKKDANARHKSRGAIITEALEIGLKQLKRKA